MTEHIATSPSISGARPPVAQQFWELWQREPRPDLLQFVDLVGPLRPADLAAVVSIDLRERWAREEQPSAEHYLRMFPPLDADREAALDVVYCEFLLRDGLGEAPPTAEYADRFPDLQPELGRQIAMHRAIAGGPPTLQTTVTGPLVREGPHQPIAEPLLPGYALVGQLGQGGMGVVHKAWQSRLQRLVAVKMLLDGRHAAPEARARFLVEGEAVARLHHPNIVQIHEVGEANGSPYLVMEFADGGSLAQKLNGTPWAGAQATALVETLARAVHHAHQRGVLHRDLTPGNVLLLADGTPKLSDFGLAKLLSGDAALTQTGAVLGTPAYMAPEQALSAAREPGPAIDIYALGAILYELLTGRPPFKAATVVETLAQVAHSEPVAPRQLQPQVPRDVETICLKCLHKEPARRYASALDLAEDLARFRQGRPIAARPVGAPERAWRWARRNPGWGAMLTTTTLLVLCIAVGASLMSLSLHHALDQSNTQKERAVTAERAATDALWVSYVQHAQARALSGARGQRFEGLAAVRKALQLPVPADHALAELRNAAIACLVLPDVATARVWMGCQAIGMGVDAPFERYALGSKEGHLTLWRVGDVAPTALLAGVGRVAWGSPSFSPDGRFLEHRCTNGQLKLWRLDGLKPALVFHEVIPGPYYESTTSFSADSRLLAVGQADGRVTLYDTAKGKKVKQFQVGLRPERLAFRPGQPQLAVAGKHLVRFIDVDSGKALPMELAHPRNLYGIAWSPDGRVLATTCNDLKIRLWDVDSGNLVLPALEGHHRLGMLVAFNHAGDVLVSNDWNGSMRLWDVATGRQLLATPSEALLFSADDRLLGTEYAAPQLRLLRVAVGRELRILSASNGSPDQRVYRSAWPSPDGRFLLVDAFDSLVFVDWASGTEVASLPFPRTGVVGFEDGALLTSGPEGLLRWPMRHESASGRHHVGPPQRLIDKRFPEFPVSTRDGKVVLIPSSKRGALLLRRPDRWLTLGPREDVRSCALSPDGVWAATGNHNNEQGIGATIWDTHSGKAVKDLPVAGLCGVGFSPDGNWLLTTGGGYRLWKKAGGTWQAGPAFAVPGHFNGFAFAPDSKVLALTGDVVGQVRLVSPHSGTEIARLSVPEQTPLNPQCFSRDGSQLAAIGRDNGHLYLWDLRAIRAQLKELGLDWDMPDYPPAASLRAGPARVEVDLGTRKKGDL